MNRMRLAVLTQNEPQNGPVLYWMSRDQRAEDNWALIHAQEMAIERRVPLAVVFCLVPEFLGATLRQYAFMLTGLEEVETQLRKKGIGFELLAGSPTNEIPRHVRRRKIGLVVTDFDPLRIKRFWKNKVSKEISVPLVEVDAHNIVPCQVVSQKQEYGAYTLRPKLLRLLPDYLDEFPRLKKHPFSWPESHKPVDWDRARKSLKIERSVGEVNWLKPGLAAAKRALRSFVEKRLERYDTDRNDPNLDGQSNLSPYLHFGQLSAQRVALEVSKSGADQQSKDAFLEELIVRRELSDNLCFYKPDYDSPACFPDWAKKTLEKHLSDERQYLYDTARFEHADTHDDLWNAAQMRMVKTGKMHGYMRMYWAKKILEWSRSPSEAVETAIYLNDRYELDGRDPNGYAGIAWSIGGVHDRAWPERPVFGKVRFMSYNGCKSKFDVSGYIEKVRSL